METLCEKNIGGRQLLSYTLFILGYFESFAFLTVLRQILNLYQVKSHSISNRFFQCFSYIIDTVHQNSPSMHFRRPIQIQEGQYGFRKANTDSGGPIRIQEGHHGFRRANTEPSVHFRKANMEQSMHFRRANTKTY